MLRHSKKTEMTLRQLIKVMPSPKIKDTYTHTHTRVMRQPINGCFDYFRFKTHKRCRKLLQDRNDAIIINAFEDEEQ
jgi:hypothetical protein